MLPTSAGAQEGQSQQTDALPPGSGSEGGASKGPSERVKSLWKRGATKAIITNALTKSTGGLPPPAQVWGWLQVQ